MLGFQMSEKLTVQLVRWDSIDSNNALGVHDLLLSFDGVGIPYSSRCAVHRLYQNYHALR